jgi:thiamine kinase-like enzyme
VYRVNKLSTLSLTVLLNDPKRNYRGIRIITFYIKVVLNSIIKRNNESCDISYDNENKLISFYSDFTTVLFKSESLNKKHKFLLQNGIITGTYRKENLLEIPRYKIFPSELSTKEVFDLLINRVVTFHSFSYLDKEIDLNELIASLEKCHLSLNDEKVFKNIICDINSHKPLVKFSHGDLWRGNICFDSGNLVLIDWDDSAMRTFAFDIFYFLLSTSNLSFLEFYKNSIVDHCFTYKCYVQFCEKTHQDALVVKYKFYLSCFLLLRLSKRYAL